VSYLVFRPFRRILRQTSIGQLSLGPRVELRAFAGQTGPRQAVQLIPYDVLDGLTPIAEDSLGHQAVESLK